ncbi:MAG TPA: bifunctional diaminohydroxyphosphoribosylaminopyrimidine deaminase/5-amino-6-(5-phosphoribosylamino)uracil reductase RibD [Bryobacteraceae bacterium]|nr:bifunctional diaminohydroxyphosphoribosylaminopyrimidine deaminase/5-amino-6-(5-phosphoribosylamino)uracil reductase RibD [Bryobacteraceae bacterium]
MTPDYMAQALGEARKGLGQTSPNPSVGAVIVKDGEVVGRGFHLYARRDHAEIVALAEAGEKARGATVYVTLEPCAHEGRTGPCVEALIAAGAGSVVVAMEDPNPLVSGRGLARLRAAGIPVRVDAAYSAEAEALNEPFCFFMREHRPLVTLKSALTLDGKIAAPDDNEGWITSDQARAHVQQLRHMTDAIVTGVGTVEADDCSLTDRTGLPRSRPLLRIVVDSQLRVRPDSQMVRQGPKDLLIATTSAGNPDRRRALEREGVEIAVLDGPDGRTNLRALVELLAGRKYQSLMIEAGSKVNGAALDAGIVDKIFFYYAPKMFGGLQSLPVAGGRGRRRRDDAMLFRDVRLHPMSRDEFAVEAWVVRGERA